MAIPQPGDRVGRYRIDGVIGRGGMGVVYAATDTRLNRTVALKVITGTYARDPEFRRRFQTEASILAQIDSPHVIAISDHDEVDGMPFIVTQYVDGTDLGSLVRTSGPLPVETALGIASQVARGLSAAHRRGVIHRDVKPSNVLVRDVGTPDLHAYLIDFGIARDTTTDGVTRSGSVAGTWAYLAPERTRSAPLTPASDLYALGCVLWQSLTGAPPYTGDEVQVAIAHAQAPLPQLPGDSPFVRDLNGVLARLLAKDPGDRYGDAASARSELDRLARAAPTGSRFSGAEPDRTAVRGSQPTDPDTTADETARPARPARRRRAVLAALAGAAVLVLGGAVWALEAAGGPSGDGPAPRAAIKGDVDEDGRGDAMVLQARADVAKPFQTQLFRSTGNSFEDPTVSPVGLGAPALGDPDGDGRSEVTWVQADPGTTGLTVRVDPGDGHPWEPWTWSAQPGTEGADLFNGDVPAVRFADLTGDGRDDLVLRNVTPDHRLVVNVAAAVDGGFQAPRQWYAGHVDADAVGATAVVVWPGDADGDGLTDLLAVWHTAPTAGRPSHTITQAFLSDRTSLRPGPTGPVAIPDAAATLPTVGDVDGDGSAELVWTFPARGTVWEVSPGGPGHRVWSARPPVALPGYSNPALSDVDGDGRADLVTIAGATRRHPRTVLLRVMLSEGDGFADPVLWESWNCADECHDRFRFIGN